MSTLSAVLIIMVIVGFIALVATIFHASSINENRRITQIKEQTKAELDKYFQDHNFTFKNEEFLTTDQKLELLKGKLDKEDWYKVHNEVKAIEHDGFCKRVKGTISHRYFCD